MIGVRVKEEDEMIGLDLSQHGEEGYNLDMDLVGSRGSSLGSGSASFVPATGVVEE